MALISSILALRRDPRILKLPPYLSALCIVIGVSWLLVLPLNQYSRQTYVSENAILPGQVHTYYGGSEHDVFRAYRHEVAALADSSVEERSQKLNDIFRGIGLKVAQQDYTYIVGGRNISGRNSYAMLQGPRADATEAIVLVAAWRNMDDAINYSAVALVMSLARYFKRRPSLLAKSTCTFTDGKPGWSIWSKDIIFLIPSDSTAGTQAWVDAYHDNHDPSTISSLPLKAGALQGAVALDYPAGPWGHRFDKLHVVYDGTNGQLPNLDLFNTAVSIASGQMGIGCTIQRMWRHNDSYQERLQTMLRGMISQGLGHASGPHSAFMPYHVDAITLQTVGDGWHDEMSLGRTVESLFRSLNNLLEHLHQSFFFYLLMHANRFVSIGTYLPSAMLVAVSFSITAIALWVQSGRPPKSAGEDLPSGEKGGEPDMTVIKEGGAVALVPTATLEIVERQLAFPLAAVLGLHFLGIVSFYTFNHVAQSSLQSSFFLFAVLSALLPPLATFILSRTVRPSAQEYTLLHSFSLLLLGASLSTLATLNFSLSLLVGLCASPLSFIRPFPRRLLASLPPSLGAPLFVVSAVVLTAVSPMAILGLANAYWGRSVVDLLADAAFGWTVWGMWTSFVIWGVWWPAWVVGACVLWSGIFVEEK
ncbi:Glycosyl phosphatidyl inositol protein transamidase complex subunit [Elasticomyces elasticus]|nr:Glycosyl phosphatidyl inositol protein transamidase complex subunit [Elasticomyces elasticus]